MWVGGEPGRTYDDMLKIIKDVEQDIKEKGYTDSPFYEITYTENNTKKILYGKLFPAYIDYDLFRSSRCGDKDRCNDDLSRMKERIYSHVKFNTTKDENVKKWIRSENRNVYYSRNPIGLILFEYDKPVITNGINVMEFYLPWNYLNIFLSLFKEQHTEFFNTVSIKKISEEDIKKNLEAAKAAAPVLAAVVEPVEPAVPEAALAPAEAALAPAPAAVEPAPAAVETAVEPAPVPVPAAVPAPAPVPVLAAVETAAAAEAVPVPVPAPAPVPVPAEEAVETAAAAEALAPAEAAAPALAPAEAEAAAPSNVGGTKRNKNRRRKTKRQRK